METASFSRALAVYGACTVTDDKIYDTGGKDGTYSKGEDYTCTVPCSDSQVVIGSTLTYDMGGTYGYAYVELWDGDTIVDINRGTGIVTSSTVHTQFNVHVWSHSSYDPTGTGFELAYTCGVNPCQDTECSGNMVVSYDNDECSCQCPGAYSGVNCEVIRSNSCCY